MLQKNILLLRNTFLPFQAEFLYPLLLRLTQFVLSVHTPTASQPKAQPQITQTAFTINIGDEVKKVWIPKSVKDVFTNEVQIPEDNNIATTENVAHVAMLFSSINVRKPN